MCQLIGVAKVRPLGLALTLAFVGAVLVACSDDDTPAVTLGGNLSLDEAKAFDKFALFWAGEQYTEFPLSTIIRADYVSAERPGLTVKEDSVSFLYGSCEVPESGDGGCPAPYQLSIHSACSMLGLVSPELFERRVMVNGVAGDVYPNAGQFVLWTQDVILTVFGPQGTNAEPFVSSLTPSTRRLG